MSAYRFVTVRQAGETFTPVVDRAGRIQDLAQLARLAATTCAVPDRTVDFVLLDEGAPRSDDPPFRIGHVGLRAGLELQLGDSELAVGRVELVESRPAGTTVATVGAHLLARARLHATILADAVWRGILAGHLRGVCPVVLDWEADQYEFRKPSEPTLEVLAVRLGALADSCLTGASIRGWTEAPRPSWARVDLLSLPARTPAASVRLAWAGARRRPVGIPGGGAAGAILLRNHQ